MTKKSASQFKVMKPAPKMTQQERLLEQAENNIKTTWDQINDLKKQIDAMEKARIAKIDASIEQMDAKLKTAADRYKTARGLFAIRQQVNNLTQEGQVTTETMAMDSDGRVQFIPRHTTNIYVSLAKCANIALHAAQFTTQIHDMVLSRDADGYIDLVKKGMQLDTLVDVFYDSDFCQLIVDSYLNRDEDAEEVCTVAFEMERLTICSIAGDMLGDLNDFIASTEDELEKSRKALADLKKELRDYKRDKKIAEAEIERMRAENQAKTKTEKDDDVEQQS